MIRKTILFALILCISFSFAQAQSLLNKIPQDASFVVTFNPGTLNSKMKLASIKEYDFYKMGMQQAFGPGGAPQQVADLLNDPSQFGMDLMASSHIFGKISEAGVYFGFIFKLNDAGKFNQLITDMTGGMMKVEDKGDYKMMLESDVALAWNDGYAFFGGAELTPNYDEEYSIRKEKQQQAIASWVNSTVGGSSNQSILQNTQYMMTKAKGKNDAHAWMDYAGFMKMYTGMTGDYMGQEQRMMMDMMAGLYDGMHVAAGLNFDEGAIRLTYDAFLNDRLMKISKGMTDSKFNKKFHKYVPKDQLMGYLTFNYNLEKMVEGSKEIMMPMLNQIPTYGSMINDAMDIIGIAIDEDALYNLWKGDMMVAVTGLKNYEKTITTFEYDEEFNRTEVEKTVNEQLPEFTMMVSYGSKDDINKFIRLGEKSSYLSNKGGYYLLNIPDLPMDAYLAMHDGVFFLTNNLDLVQNKLSSGYSKSARLGKDHCKRIKKNAQVVYWNIPTTIDQTANLMGVPMEGPTGDMVDLSKKSFDSMVWETAKIKGNSSRQELRLNFSDKKANSLKQLCDYMNKMFLSAMGGGLKM